MFILRKFIFLFSILLICSFFSSCASSGRRGNEGKVQSFIAPNVEADWIRNGEPIEFEGDMWYPVDGIEGLIDSEVSVVAEYRGVQVFVDRIDVRPYNRLYTKFGNNKFRYYRKNKQE